MRLHKNLVTLSSNSYLKHKNFNEPFYDLKDLDIHKEGLIVTLGGLNVLLEIYLKKIN